MTSLTGYGNCAQTTNYNGYWTTYAYGVNASGYPTTTVTQNAQASSGKQTRVYTYDLLGRLISEQNPENGTTTYTYDSDSAGNCSGTYNGDLVKLTDAKGNKTCYQYDAIHRRTQISYPSGPDAANTPTKTFVYESATYNGNPMSNAITHLAEAYTGASGSKTTDEFFSYSVRGELTDTWECTPHSGTNGCASVSNYYRVTEGFWANGALNTLSSNITGVPTQTYGVDGEGRPYSVSAATGQNPVTSAVYDLANYKTTVTYGSLDSDVVNLDPNTGRMTKYTFNVGSNADTGTTTWNANGSLASLAISDAVTGTADTQTCSYTHDDLARISSAGCVNGATNKWNQNFTYDPFGNITKTVPTGGTGITFQPTYSSSTNWISALPGVTPTTDANGQMTYDGTHNYAWDAAGKMRSVDSTTLTHDALGRLVEKAVGTTYTQIVYGPRGKKFAVMNGQTLQKAFIPLPRGAKAVYTSTGLTYYRHADHLGSSRLATTPSRTLYSSSAYAPFGEPYTQAGTTDLSFTGQDQDAVSGMHDFLFRKYVPAQGRWLSPDPAGLGAVNPANPQSWNRYAYVINHPTALVDPLGLFYGPCGPVPCSAGDDGGDGSGDGGGNGGQYHAPLLDTTDHGGGGGGRHHCDLQCQIDRAKKDGRNALNDSGCSNAVDGGDPQSAATLQAAATLDAQNGAQPLATINVFDLGNTGAGIVTEGTPVRFPNAPGIMIPNTFGPPVTMTINSNSALGFANGLVAGGGYGPQASQDIGLLHDLGHAAFYNGLPTAVVTPDATMVNGQVQGDATIQNNQTIGDACFPQGDFGGSPDIGGDGGDMVAHDERTTGGTATTHGTDDREPNRSIAGNGSSSDGSILAGPSGKRSHGEQKTGTSVYDGFLLW